MTRPARIQIPQLDSDWIAGAACAKLPGLPWIENPRRVPDFLLDFMGEICGACPVRSECEDFAEQAHITAGFWAGASRNHLEVSDFQEDGNGGGWAA